MLDWSVYLRTAAVFARQGFNVIPLPPCTKRPIIRFADLNKPDSRRINRDDINNWRQQHNRRDYDGLVGAYLLPNSKGGWHYTIVDIDDQEFEQTARGAFGSSRFSVRRGSRNRHYYYRSEDSRRAHLLQAYGPRSVDIIATTGVVLPGSIHPDGDEYEASVPIEQWHLMDLPVLNLEKVDELRHAQRETNRVEIESCRRSAPAIRDRAGFIHARAPRQYRNSLWCGYVLPRTGIHTEMGDTPLEELQSGTKCYATYRGDNTPSAHVRDYRGKRYFYDMSTEPKRYWTMTESNDDPHLIQEPGENYIDALARNLRDRLGLEVEILDANGYIADQVPELPDNVTAFLVAAHGTGKTIMAKAEHARAATSISVCNTQALTVANAAVLGLTAIYQEIAAKASCCIPSLHRYTHPPEFFHIDEADAVHGYLHAGKMDDPLEAWLKMLDFASRAKRSLLASADLQFEDIAMFVDAIRDREPQRRFVVYLKRPKSSLTVRLAPIGYVKAEVHKAIKKASGVASPTGTQHSGEHVCSLGTEGVPDPTIKNAAAGNNSDVSRLVDQDRVPNSKAPGPVVVSDVEPAGASNGARFSPEQAQAYPIFVGSTKRKIAGEITQGYRALNAKRTISLAAVADAIDSPRPAPIKELAEEMEADKGIANSDEGISRCARSESNFYVSGENSRFHESVKWLEDTDKLVNEHSLICTSPAVVSGVSLVPPVSRVFVLHDNRSVQASAVLQLARRVRNPVDTTILIGVQAWRKQEHRYDRDYLDDLIEQRSRITLHAIFAHLPTFEDLGSPNDEFLRSWRVTIARQIQSYADPLGELEAAARRHGLAFEHDTEVPIDLKARKAFGKITRKAWAFRREINAQQISAADPIGPDRREKLDRAAKLQSGERQELARAVLTRFYDLPVTPELVLLDNGNKYRKKVRLYTHVMLLAEHEGAVARLDSRSAHEEPTNRSHNLAQAFLLADMYRQCTGQELTPAGGEWLVKEAAPRIRPWYWKNMPKLKLFFNRMRGPVEGIEIKWLCQRIRDMGGVITNRGANSNVRKVVNFEQIDQHATAYGQRLLASHRRDK